MWTQEEFFHTLRQLNVTNTLKCVLGHLTSTSVKYVISTPYITLIALEPPTISKIEPYISFVSITWECSYKPEKVFFLVEPELEPNTKDAVELLLKFWTEELLKN